MIKFFRKIRQNLLMENKTGKYLKYAIGEIVLVVIGILIALQVNNWNESRKLRNTEIGLLKELRADLTATLDDLKSDIELVNRTLTNTDSIHKKMRINLMNKSTEPFPVKINHLLNPILYPKLGAYEALQSYGINNISNDEIKVKVKGGNLVVKFEKDFGIEMPISHAVYDALYHSEDPRNTIRDLMVRPLKNERH